MSKPAYICRRCERCEQITTARPRGDGRVVCRDCERREKKS